MMGVMAERKNGARRARFSVGSRVDLRVEDRAQYAEDFHERDMIGLTIVAISKSRARVRTADGTDLFYRLRSLVPSPLRTRPSWKRIDDDLEHFEVFGEVVGFAMRTAAGDVRWSAHPKGSKSTQGVVLSGERAWQLAKGCVEQGLGIRTEISDAGHSGSGAGDADPQRAVQRAGDEGGAGEAAS